jgi:hypothetical protein
MPFEQFEPFDRRGEGEGSSGMNGMNGILHNPEELVYNKNSCRKKSVLLYNQ